MIWDNAEVLMQSPDWLDSANIDSFEAELFMAHDPDTTDAERIQKILDLKYSKANLKEIVKELDHLSKDQQKQLLGVLNKFESLFDGTLGTWNTKPVELELKDPDCKPVHAKPYPVPQSQERKLRDEVKRLCDAGILRKINES